MVHIGGAPAHLGELMELLRPGDIITHCFTPAPHGLVEDGQLIKEAQARESGGIIFDVGHGFGSFDYGSSSRRSSGASGPTRSRPTCTRSASRPGRRSAPHDGQAAEPWDAARGRDPALRPSPAEIIGRSETTREPHRRGRGGCRGAVAGGLRRHFVDAPARSARGRSSARCRRRSGQGSCGAAPLPILVGLRVRRANLDFVPPR